MRLDSTKSKYVEFTYALNTGLVTYPAIVQPNGVAGINTAGQFVGSYAPYYQHGFLQDTSGSFVDLYTGYYGTIATGINNDGTTVGFGNTPNGQSPFMYTQSGGFTNLGFVGQAMAINDNGLIVGWDNSSNMIEYSPANGVTNFGRLGTNGIFPYAINNAGNVTGYMNVSNYYHAFMYLASVGLVDIGGLLPTNTNSYAYSINSSGVVVGHADNGGAFIYSNGTTQFLSSLLSAPLANGQSLNSAFAINDSGWILALDGSNALWLLVPSGTPGLCAVAICQ